MDAERLASVLRSLATSGSRRTVLGGVIAGPAVFQRLTQAKASSRKKRKKSPCARQPNDASCKGTGRCLSGICNPKPTCLGFGADCTTNRDGCCCHLCKSKSGVTYTCLHDGANAGDPCQSDDDCDNFTFHLRCVGYVCQSTSCGPASDACVDQTLVCGNGGLCLRPSGGGDARCGAFTPTTSCGCTSDRQCRKQFGTGAFCATFTRDRETFCECQGKSSFCAIPA
ncbi:MAG TPA: hypothetical protein VFU81_10565 [Thermomicrobiales bacterium]|nr:hypothetical protein [Thermomicrobiales bacterium]